MKKWQTVDPDSSLYQSHSTPSFQDAVSIELARHDVESWEPIAAFIQCSPSWLVTLFHIRNAIASRLGLKSGLADLDDLALPYDKGRMFGVMEVLDIGPDEAILGADDSHLNFRISFLIKRTGQGASLSFSTSVDVHNFIGKAYMFFVTPVHKMIIPIMLRRMARLIDERNMPQYEGFDSDGMSHQG